MHQFMGLISRVVVATVLVGLVTGCNRVPFPGRNQSANQTGDTSDTTQNQPGTRTQVQRANSHCGKPKTIRVMHNPPMVS
jgi:hypothetical protein